MERSTDISRGVEHCRIGVDPPELLSDMSDFVYVRCNIPGPDYSRKEFAEQFEGCLCSEEEGCSKGCPCLAKYGPCYSDGKLTVENSASVAHKPVLECNKACECSKQCPNRVVQNGVCIPLTVFKTEQKGYGLKCESDIPANTFVCEYAGEILSHESARKRAAGFVKSGSASFFIMVLREHLGTGDVMTTYVDPTFIGNIGRFINHSCDPNLYMVPVRVNNNIPKLALFARQNIAAGEELTYNYSGVVHEEQTELDVVNEELEGNTSRKPCFCGTVHCLGFLPYDQSLFSGGETNSINHPGK